MLDLQSYVAIFWDFDGVIKDSVEVKTRAYVQLFQPFGVQVAERVRKHHEVNGGMSRFEKLPIYLNWSGVTPTEAKVREYCDKFSQAATQGVVDSPWVDGVERVLRNKNRNQIYVLVSATPQAELEWILQQLQITDCFEAVYGAPNKKGDAIKEILNSKQLNSQSCLMIGDATADMLAADINQVPFLLRKHSENSRLFSTHLGPFIKDFSNV